jgi:quinol monooxygenase YgiN
MATLFVKHNVKDYGNWKRIYDELSATRKQNGVTGASVYRDPEAPNTLIVTHRFNNMKSAQAFAGSEALKSAMANAGVSGPPEIWFGEEIETTSF